MRRLVAALRRHRLRVWLLWALGAAALLAVPFALADPAVWLLVLDPELLALLVVSGAALLGETARTLVARSWRSRPAPGRDRPAGR